MSVLSDSDMGLELLTPLRFIELLQGKLPDPSYLQVGNLFSRENDGPYKVTIQGVDKFVANQRVAKIYYGAPTFVEQILGFDRGDLEKESGKLVVRSGVPINSDTFEKREHVEFLYLENRFPVKLREGGYVPPFSIKVSASVGENSEITRIDRKRLIGIGRRGIGWRRTNLTDFIPDDWIMRFPMGRN